MDFGFNKKTILVVDDEESIIELLVYNLQKEGYNTLQAYDGVSAVEIALKEKPDLILLDVMLPKMDGISVCKRIRYSFNVPILMISAKDTELDKVVGLEMGADDYITKPFKIREVMARIKANLRKSELISMPEYNTNTTNNVAKAENNEPDSNIIVVGDLSLDLKKVEAKVKGEVVDLTIKEFEVLKYLAAQPGEVVTREMLLKKVWGYDDYVGAIRTVDVTVNRIRDKIEKDKANPKILITKRGVGYYVVGNKA
ncbi:MAG: response regulator transcription factor [Clostridia bacterium]|nr:response regulator transcription factor [Clostridia bacterium]